MDKVAQKLLKARCPWATIRRMKVPATNSVMLSINLPSPMICRKQGGDGLSVCR
jgi:hypothetical protein